MSIRPSIWECSELREATKSSTSSVCRRPPRWKDVHQWCHRFNIFLPLTFCQHNIVRQTPDFLWGHPIVMWKGIKWFHDMATLAWWGHEHVNIIDKGDSVKGWDPERGVLILTRTWTRNHRRQKWLCLSIPSKNGWATDSWGDPKGGDDRKSQYAFWRLAKSCWTWGYRR